ncbi:tRNA-splicing endonuclease subunit [Entomortierella chlamydospora]|uniref:tRNA-splicing endonuclease subunit Sen34 n=1 Tax=Entomortierella chlamydospora TaxID=101097 RepID=A0A9P6MWX3_9FUNG|nr:tRNA-splicing endonuclease subunit [Entomortierella chlamydospora]
MASKTTELVPEDCSLYSRTPPDDNVPPSDGLDNGYPNPSTKALLDHSSIGSSIAAVKPRVFLSGHEALVWDVHDVRQLRQTHRIVGSLAGSLPRNSMQNIFQGLPLRLLPEEVYALWSSGLIDLVDENRAHQQTSAPMQPELDLTISAKAPSKNIKSGAERITLHTLSKHLQYFPPAVVQLQRSSSGICNSSSTISLSSQDVASAPLPYRLDGEYSNSPLNYPANTKQHLRCTVFIHLWASLRFFIAPGIKFGGDYLLYRNDPLICHASLIATVDEAEAPLSLADLASSARLASTVQKQHVLCSTVKPIQQHPSSANSTLSPGMAPRTKSQSTSDNVVMFVIEWAGF